VDQVGVRAIQAMLAPVVLMTTAAILAAGVQAMYSAVNDRMRVMTAERFAHLIDAKGELISVTALPSGARERLRQIDVELPMLSRRHRLIHHGLLLMYSTVLFVVIAMILVAVSVTVPVDAAGVVALAFVLVGTVALMLGLVFVARSVHTSANAVNYEMREVLRLGS
jgi:hypothetical protein